MVGSFYNPNRLQNLLSGEMVKTRELDEVHKIR